MSIARPLRRVAAGAFLLASFGSLALLFFDFGALFKPFIVIVWSAWAVTMLAAPASWFATGVLRGETSTAVRAHEPARFWVGFITYTALLLCFFIAASVLLFNAYRAEAQPVEAPDPPQRASPASAGR